MKNLLLVLLVAFGFAQSVFAHVIWIDGVKWAYYDVGSGVAIGQGPSATESGLLVTNENDWATLTIPTQIVGKTVVEIGPHAFSGCSKLVAPEIPHTVTNIAAHAFSNCSGMKSVGIPTNLVSIGSEAFYRCSSLASVAFPTNLIGIGTYAFSGCSELKSVSFPPDLASIGSYAFSGCSSLTSVSFPSNLTSIANETFYYCSSLAEFSIPESVASVGNDAFLGTAYWNAETNTLVVKDGCLLGVKGTCVSDVVLPEGCRVIADYAFVDHREVDSIRMPDSLRGIGAHAFAETWMTNVTFGAGITNIGKYAFYKCAGLTEALIPTSIVAIAQEAFADCSGLVAVDFPSGLRQIGYCAFLNCTGLLRVSLPTGASDIGSEAFGNCTHLAEVEVRGEDTGLSWSSDCWTGCTALKTVTLTSSIRLSSFFSGVYQQLETITFTAEAKPTEIIASAFSGCKALKTLAVPFTVVSVGNEAFKGCAALPSLTLPRAVTNLGANVFSDCTALTNVAFLGDAPTVSTTLYAGAPAALVTSVGPSSTGWDGSTNRVTTLPEKWPTAASEANQRAIVHWTGYTVTLDANGGTVSETSREYSSGAILGALPTPVRTGYASVGWYTMATGGVAVTATNVVERDMTLYAHWAPNSYQIRFDANGGTGSVTTVDCTYDVAVRLPSSEFGRPDYELIGWAASSSGTAVFAPGAVVSNLTSVAGETVPLYAVWVRPAERIDYPLVIEDARWAARMAATYDGYLVDTNTLEVAGTMTLKVAKRKVNASLGITNIALTATITPFGGRKCVFRGALASDGTALFEGGLLVLKLSANGLTGNLGDFLIIGVRNRFQSGTLADLTHAARVLERVRGTWRLALRTVSAEGEGAELAAGCGVLTVKVGSRGKAAISGTLGDGTKLSVTSQLLVGDAFCRIPICAPLYKNKAGGFAALLQIDEANRPKVIGLTGWTACAASAAKAFEAAWEVVAVTNVAMACSTNAVFASGEPPAVIGSSEVYDEYLPTNVAISVSSTGKWTLPTRGSVKWDSEMEEPVPSEKGADNLSALCLTHTLSTGMFRGSFRVYAVEETEVGKSSEEEEESEIETVRRLRTWTANVTGVMCGDRGYGTAVISGRCSMPVVVEVR